MIFVPPLAASETFLIWENTINSWENQVGLAKFLGMPPEISVMDPSKVQQKFMSNITYFSMENDIYVNISIWQGPVATWKAKDISFDTQDKIHGECELFLKQEFFNNTGYHHMLQWSLKYISGRFEHGKLEGGALLVTWRGVILYATFSAGELHGPIHSYGRKFLYDLEVIKCLLILN